VQGTSLRGLSHQPLLDACRAIKRMGGDPRARAGLFRKGRYGTPDLACTVAWGAGHTVAEDDVAPIRFEKFRPGPAERARQKKEGST